MDQADALVELLTKIAVPLITIDGGTLHVVEATPARVHLHLGGTYAGCPGNAFVESHLLAPLVRAVFPDATLQVTSGRLRHEGARRLGPATEPMPERTVVLI
ncbi:MAG: hypothetical protein BGO98_30530 [Myxococcales bacterium 68-20]|nr:hypothetical protein [Myxococcales bacterium]OJY16421.1 MAG: hypothetical protein BGO98_30530 [Myxococcales bacterium 68-20]